ncbi:MAG: DUF2934 domain-containing protein [Burkholderia gladioli]
MDKNVNDDQENQVRELAYALWRDDGSPDGQADVYWYRAQEQLLAHPDRAPGLKQSRSAPQGTLGVPLEDDDVLPPGQALRGDPRLREN